MVHPNNAPAIHVSSVVDARDRTQSVPCRPHPGVVGNTVHAMSLDVPVRRKPQKSVSDSAMHENKYVIYHK
jgi:hypothetical protein